MKLSRIAAFGLILALLIAPLSVLAQDNGPELDEYYSEDGLLTVMGPAGWFQPENNGFPFSSVMLLNTEEAAAEPNADPMPGVKGVFSVVIPLDALSMFGGTVPENATLTELADFVVGLFAAPDENASEEEIAAIETGKAEEVDLGNGVMAASVEASNLHQQGVYFVRQLGEGVIGLVYTAAYKGEFDDAQRELGRQAAATLSYAGTAEDLMAGMMAQPQDQPGGQGPELQEYVSEDGLLSVVVPKGWFEAHLSGFPFPNVAFVQSQETVDRVQNDEDFVAGDKGILAAVLPRDVFAQFGEPIPEDATVIDLGNYIANVFGSPDENATDEQIAASQIGEAEEVELSDGITAAQVAVSSLSEDDAYFVRDLGNGLIGLVLAGAASGELDDAQIELGRQAAASLSYEGTAEDIMAAMMAPPEVEQSDVDPATLDGNALVDERCTVCHTRERIDAADKDEAGWTATVDRMIGHGAQLDSAERQAVIDYLVETH